MADVSDSPESPAQTWLRARARLMPNLLSHSPQWIQGVFDHSWAPMRAMAAQIDRLPAHLWRQLLCWESGYLVIQTGETCYRPGPARIRHQQVSNVAFVSIEDLALGNERPLRILGHLIDHSLGCAGKDEGLWLSSGGGMSPEWQRAGQRLVDLFALGYGVDQVAQSSVRDYFAQSLALFCLERERLNLADPQVYKWLRSTVWNAALWRKFPNRRQGDENTDA